MFSNGLFLIATNLIVLAHVHSFVLLTANFDDVKKLAQKFVSESIAETIAQFVAKASGNKIDTKTSKEMNVPKSRDYQLDSVSVSEEDNETNITKESISKENMKYKSKAYKSKHKTRYQSKFIISSEERTNKKKEKKRKNKGHKNFNIISKSNNLNDFSEDSANNKVSVESTAGYQDERVSDKNLTSDQDEDSASEFDFQEGKFKIDRSFTFTTRKEKIEFDQYDNTNYPRAVATSGSVTLRRLLDSRKSRYRD